MLSKDKFMLSVGFFILSYFVLTTKEEKEKAVLETLEKFVSTQNGGGLKNIYDEDLEPCGDYTMGSGSWDQSGKCSELTGGVHQICYKNIDNPNLKFSLNTGQGDWSSSRNRNSNHCLCLGAWSLYVAKNKRDKIEYGDKIQLENNIKCSAIPKNSLSKDYVGKFAGWDKWNGLELGNQTKDGVEELFTQCKKQAVSDNQLNSLKNNYCNFAKNIESLKKSQIYKDNCDSI